MVLNWSNLSPSRRYSLITGILSILIGTVFILLTVSLPSASVGMPNAPKVFPLGLGVLLVVLGLMLLIQQYNLLSREPRSADQQSADPELQHAKSGRAGLLHRIPADVRNIVITIANCLLYAFLFNPMGFVLATIIFLGLELFLFNGLGKWKTVLIVSSVFSVVVYVLFSTLLGVYLPRMPFIGL